MHLFRPTNIELGTAARAGTMQMNQQHELQAILSKGQGIGLVPAIPNMCEKDILFRAPRDKSVHVGKGWGWRILLEHASLQHLEQDQVGHA